MTLIYLAPNRQMALFTLCCLQLGQPVVENVEELHRSLPEAQLEYWRPLSTQIAANTIC